MRCQFFNTLLKWKNSEDGFFCQTCSESYIFPNSNQTIFYCKYFTFSPLQQTNCCNCGTSAWFYTGKVIINRGKQTTQINDISVSHIWSLWTTELTITHFP